MRFILSVINFGIVVSLLAVKKKMIWEPIIVYSLFWAIIIFLASLQLFDLFPISNQVYLMFELGYIAFIIGEAFWGVFGGRIRIEPFASSGKRNYVIRYKLLIVCVAVVSLFMAYRFRDYLSLVRQGYTGEELRYMFFEYEPSNTLGKYISYFQNFFATPVVYAAVILAVIDIIEGERNKFFIISVCVMVVLYIVASGGRVIILNTAFHVIFLLLITSRLHLLQLLKRYKRLLIKMGLGCILLFMILNARRGNENGGNDLIKQAYVYYTGCMQHFEKRIRVLGSDRDYGIAIFAGYIRPILLVLSKFGVPVPENYDMFMSYNSTLQSGVRIGKDVWINAFVSMNYHFYLSFGTLGIFLGNFMYGSMAGSLEKHIRRKGTNLLNMSFVLLFLQGVMTSMVRWQFVLPSYALTFVYLLVFLKRDDRIRSRNLKKILLMR